MREKKKPLWRRDLGYQWPRSGFGVPENTFLEEMISEPCAKLKASLHSPNPTCSHTSGLEEAPGPLFLGLAFLRKDFEGFLRKSN